MAPLFLFPALTTADPNCPLCERPIARHRRTARGFQCVQDVVVNRDQETQTRRARLAQLQMRALKVQPWAADVEEAAR